MTTKHNAINPNTLTSDMQRMYYAVYAPKGIHIPYGTKHQVDIHVFATMLERNQWVGQDRYDHGYHRDFITRRTMDTLTRGYFKGSAYYHEAGETLCVIDNGVITQEG